MSKKILSLLLALALVGSGGVANAADGDAWVPNVKQGAAGTNSFFIAEATQGSLLSTRVGGGSGQSWWCAEFSGPQCDPAANSGNWYQQYSVLPACLTVEQENCVESLKLISAAQENQAAIFDRQIDGIKFAADPKLGTFEASTVSLWNTPAGSAGAAVNYAVNVRVLQNYNRVTGKFEPASLSAIVMPYRLQPGEYGVPTPKTIENSKGTGTLGVAIDQIAQDCVWNDTGKCGVLQEFQDGVRASLTIRLTKKIGGWFMGRLASPNISIANFSATANLVSVDASPVDVPRLQAVVPREANIPNIQNIWRGSGVMGAEWDGSAAYTEGYGGGAFSYLETFRPFTNDVAAGISNLWSFSSVAANSGNPCLADTSKVMGIVTTNATVYDGNTPQFIDGQLNYKVAGLHYQPDGKSLNLGSYDLLIRSEAARCLYGFSSAPVQATVSVVSENGVKSAATTVVAEKDGWLKLSANGFTYSNKVIKIKLAQAGSKKVTTIVCLRGKYKKPVKGIAPKCPPGFKRG